MSSFRTLAIWGALATIFSVTSNALSIPSNALEPSENRFKIDLIDVKCDKNENGMHVTVQFAEPFDGIIYSKGYFSDSKCRYISAGESEKLYNFVVPYEGCGSKPSCAICDSIDNILIIQQDEEVQGEYDTARKISCTRSGIDEEKKVFFKPFVVDMLDVVTVPTAHGGVDCWMDIQRGIFPKLTSIGDVIKIGEALTVLVYLRDQKNEYDLSVRNCWAYDDEDFDDKKTGKVQLSDASGCSMKRKLFGSWQKTDKTGSSGANLLLHNTLRAFKFPDESQIYLKCDIEICRGTCAEAICDADEIIKVDCALDPLNPKCIREPFVERTGSSIGITTVSSRVKPSQSSNIARITTQEPYIITTKRPFYGISTTERVGYTSTPLFEQESTTQKLPETTTYREATTFSNSFPITTIKPGYDSFCNRYPNHKRCNQRVTDDFGSNIEILTLKPPSPFATVKYQPVTLAPKLNEKNNEIIGTTDATVKEQPLICKGKYLDPRCPNPTPTADPPTYLPANFPQTTRKMIVPRIEASTISESVTEFTTKQPITTEQPVTQKPTNKLFICVPGSNDVNCDYESTKATEKPITQEITTIFPSRNQYITKKPAEKSICFIGSTSPECQKVSTDILTFKPRPSTTAIPPTTVTRKIIGTTRAPLCYPGSLDPRCPPPTTKIVFTTVKPVPSGIPVIVVTDCYPGSPDPGCPQVTTKRPISGIVTTQKIFTTTISETSTDEVPSTTRTPICYLGSPDPRCQKVGITERIPTIITTQETTTEIPTSTTYKSISRTNIAPRCYPGSRNPSCIQSTTEYVPATTESENLKPKTVYSTTAAPRCYLGSSDPRCPQPTTKRVSTSFGTTGQTPKVIFSTKVVSTTTPGPRCYPGSLDPRCPKPTTSTAFTSSFGTASPVTTTISTTRPTEQSSTESLVTSSISSSTALPRCYPGSLDPRCPQPPKAGVRCYPGSRDPNCIQSTTSSVPMTESENLTPKTVYSTTAAPHCYLGSPDPRCSQPTTKRVSTSFGTTGQTPKEILSTKAVSSTTPGPRCYPGSFDPRCPKPTTRTALPSFGTASQVTTKYPAVSTVKSIPSSTRAPICYPGALDPRCSQPGTTKKAITSIDTRQEETTSEIPSSTTYKFGSSTNIVPRCYPGSIDPRCQSMIMENLISTTAKSTLSTTQAQLRCYSGSLDPRCLSKQSIIPLQCGPGPLRDPRCPNPTPTAEPATYLPPYTSTAYKTTKSPIITTPVPFACTPNSLDPRCRTIFTTKTVPIIPIESLRTTDTYSQISTSKKPASISSIPIVSTTPVTLNPSAPSISTQKPTYSTTTRGPFTYPTFSTGRIYSSPQPFTSRPTTQPTVSTTTENILCYPGSPIEGCKTSFTTPSFCYPGSKDKRCPQLPPSFSTRQPSTYLPPFPDPSFNRVKRQTWTEHEQTNEIVKFSLSFKPFSFS